MRTIAPKVELLVDAGNAVGETPVWQSQQRALYWINVQDPPELFRLDIHSGDVKRWPMPGRIGGFVFKKSGGALVVLASGLFDFDLATGELSPRVRVALPDHIALHECACDPSGRFWVGGMNHQVSPENPFPGGAYLYRLDDNELVPVADGISCANGLAFSPDGRTLYFSDSTTRRCDRYELDPVTGELGGRETFFELSADEGYVDGAAVDAEGGYWATLVYAGKLRRYLPDGTLDLEIRLPFDNPTKVAFGGDDMRTIFVTSMRLALAGGEGAALDGGLFALNVGIAGRPDPLFAG